MSGNGYGYYTNSPAIKKTNGTYWVSGENAFGSCADGTLTQRTSFVQMWFPYGTQIKHFASNNNSTYGAVHFGVTEDDRIYAWGYNEVHSIHETNVNNCPLPILVNPPVLQR